MTENRVQRAVVAERDYRKRRRERKKEEVKKRNTSYFLPRQHIVI